MLRTKWLTARLAALLLACTAALVAGLSYGAFAAAPGPDAAQEQTPARQEIESLIQQLEKPAEREALIRQLRLLLEAQKKQASPAAAPSPFDHFFADLMQRLNDSFRRNIASF